MNDRKRRRDHTRTIEFKVSCPEPPELTKKTAFLTIIRGGGSDLGQVQVVAEKAVLGRSSACDLPLQDLGVSWEHAQVIRTPAGEFALSDMGSTNGTRLNGVLVENAVALQDGNKIFLGETVVRFTLADEMDLGFQTEVQQLVGTDPLTGLESKRVFDDALDYALQLARRGNHSLAVLMMDMDGTKAINDRHGHLFGAHAIGETGRILSRVIGTAGHVCRFGGDEFSAFLPDLDAQAAYDFAEAIRAAVAQTRIEKDQIHLPATISIGVAIFPAAGDHVLELVAAADRALYRAKENGKNQVSR